MSTLLSSTSKKGLFDNFIELFRRKVLSPDTGEVFYQEEYEEDSMKNIVGNIQTCEDLFSARLSSKVIKESVDENVAAIYENIRFNNKYLPTIRDIDIYKVIAICHGKEMYFIEKTFGTDLSSLNFREWKKLYPFYKYGIKFIEAGIHDEEWVRSIMKSSVFSQYDFEELIIMNDEQIRKVYDLIHNHVFPEWRAVQIVNNYSPAKIALLTYLQDNVILYDIYMRKINNMSEEKAKEIIENGNYGDYFDISLVM